MKGINQVASSFELLLLFLLLLRLCDNPYITQHHNTQHNTKHEAQHNTKNVLSHVVFVVAVVAFLSFVPVVVVQ